MKEFLPVIILFFYYVAFAVLHAAYIKISSDKIGGMRIVWRDALRVALILVAIMVIVRSLAIKSGMHISAGVLIGFSLVLYLSVGGWFLGRRVLTQQNEPAGWKAGLLISALSYVFLGITIVIADFVTKH